MRKKIQEWAMFKYLLVASVMLFGSIPGCANEEAKGLYNALGFTSSSYA